MHDDDRETERALTEELVRHGLLIPSGVPGVFGRGAVFEDILDRLERLITAAARDDGAEFLRFPPAIPRAVLERSEFLESFPQLAGSVFSFTGNEEEHRQLVQRIRYGQDWSLLQSLTDLVLTPAACYPVYPILGGELPAAGRLIDVSSWCFRHEPSSDPARLQMFRVRELVRAGDPETVLAWRDRWRERGIGLLRSLGLDVKDTAAADPFFGRGGRLLAANQREQGLKFEGLVPICSPSRPTAVVSFNYHQSHFGDLFGIRTAGGAAAHTACLGFGLERVALALCKTHGTEPARWPEAVRARLWPSA